MLRVLFEEGDPAVYLGGRPFLLRPELVLFSRGNPLREGFGELSAGPWEEVGKGWRKRYELSGEPLGEMRLVPRDGAILVEFELFRDVGFLGAEDSFTAPSLLAPAFMFPAGMDFIALTFGLGGRGERYPGGYWPEFRWGKGPAELPREAFAPLILWDDAGALAIAPGNYHLTSPLVRSERGFGRGLHGAVRSLPRGFVLKTWIVAADDPYAALRGLASLLSRHAPPVTHHPLFDSIGWWNAYGSYYTEVLHPLDEGALRAIALAFKEKSFPLGYFGLDLWYRFAPIGKAIRYQPDPAKYPRGLRALREELGFPYVLHLSALSEENEYGASPGDPEVYREIAAELRHHGAVAAWHDWLRTQQFLEKRLREDPEAAERWFSGMVEAFAEEGLPVLLCMQTMGMILAGLKHPNIVSARSYTDYLFVLDQALEEAARRGRADMLEGRLSLIEFRLQNLLVGSVYWALGIRPFFDLFLTRENPVVGGADPEGEAILRLLSMGPVGIGDRADHIDWGLLNRIIDGEGRPLRPTSPPIPLLKSLDEDLKLFFAPVELDGIPWGYLVALNASEEEASFRPEHPGDVEAVAFDPLSGSAVSGKVTVQPQGMRVQLLAPVVEGVAVLGEPGKLIPLHAGMKAHGDGGLWLELPQGGEVTLWGKQPHVELVSGRIQEDRTDGEIARYKFSPGTTVRFRR